MSQSPVRHGRAIPKIVVEPNSPESNRKPGSSSPNSAEMSDSNSMKPPAPPGPKLPGRANKNVTVTHGHSMAHWMEKVKSQPRKPVTNRVITTEELQKHNTRADCWMALRGKVFDVTDYIDYHPGGVPYILKGAGQDATKMFNNVHSYVNFESILQGRQVGLYLLGTPPDEPAKGSGSMCCKLCNGSNSTDEHVPLTSFDQDASTVQYKLETQANVDANFWSMGIMDKQILVVKLVVNPTEIWLANIKLFEPLSDDTIHFTFENQFKKMILSLQKPKPSKLKSTTLSFSCNISNSNYFDDFTDVHSLHVSLVCEKSNCKHVDPLNCDNFKKFFISSLWFPHLFNLYRQILRGQKIQEKTKWKSIGTPLKIHNKIMNSKQSSEDYYPAKVVAKDEIGPGHYQFAIATGPEVHFGVPVAWHFMLRVKGVAKAYTPVNLLTSKQISAFESLEAHHLGGILYFVIKVFKDGAFTSKLDLIPLNKEGELEIGCLKGNFDTGFLVHTDRVILLAGGTGIAPFVSIIKLIKEKRRDIRVKQVVLIQSCRTSNDILWKETWESVVKLGWFHYIPYVTRPTNDWMGRKHRFNSETIKEDLDNIPYPGSSKGTSKHLNVVAMACGPTGFTDGCKSIFQSLEIPEDKVLLFEG